MTTGKFAATLQNSLPSGVTLPQEIWGLIAWLEARAQLRHFRYSNQRLLPTMPVEYGRQLWSELMFTKVQDFAVLWGRDDLEQIIVPFIRTGADGSYIALWNDNGAQRFVFIGSELEVFHITDDPVKLLMLITMGYEAIEADYHLSFAPWQNYNEIFDDKWPFPWEVVSYISATYGVTYPVKGEALLSGIQPDPFEAFVRKVFAGEAL